jgi:acetoacetyl-CoA synthetase
VSSTGVVEQGGLAKSGGGKPSLRPLTRNDFAAVLACAAHYPGFGDATQVFLDQVERGWGREESSFGSMVLLGDEVVGYATAVFMDRRIGASHARFCCLGPWFVLPEHRMYSLPLMSSVLKDQDCTFVTMSPNSSSVKVLGRFRFEFLATDFLVFPPLAQLGTLLRGRDEICTDTGEVLSRVDDADRRTIEDHTMYGCTATLVGGNADYGLVLTKRRTLRQRPVSEILRVRNAARVTRQFERVKLAILRAERSIALMSDRRLLGGADIKGIARVRNRMYRSRVFSAAEIDNLYSEIVVR